jgi:hypothetical protein
MMRFPSSILFAAISTCVWYDVAYAERTINDVGTKVNAVPTSNRVVPYPKLPGVVNYVNPRAPGFRAPEYPGQQYAATVPATLDLAERVRSALSALAGMLNPDCDQEPYFAAYHMTDPPAMLHGDSDLNTMGKYLEAIPLVRTMSLSRQNLDVETGLRKTMRYR